MQLNEEPMLEQEIEKQFLKYKPRKNDTVFVDLNIGKYNVKMEIKLKTALLPNTTIRDYIPPGHPWYVGITSSKDNDNY